MHVFARTRRHAYVRDIRINKECGRESSLLHVYTGLFNTRAKATGDREGGAASELFHNRVN